MSKHGVHLVGKCFIGAALLLILALVESGLGQTHPVSQNVDSKLAVGFSVGGRLAAGSRPIPYQLFNQTISLEARIEYEPTKTNLFRFRASSAGSNDESVPIGIVLVAVPSYGFTRGIYVLRESRIRHLTLTVEFEKLISLSKKDPSRIQLGLFAGGGVRGTYGSISPQADAYDTSWTEYLETIVAGDLELKTTFDPVVTAGIGLRTRLSKLFSLGIECSLPMQLVREPIYYVSPDRETYLFLSPTIQIFLLTGS